MDREVAIELLKQEKGVQEEFVGMSNFIGMGKEYADKGRATIEALDLAIEALEESTVSEDCISREYMLKLQRELHGWMSNDKSHELWQKIKDAPSVTPTERTGEWWRDFDGNEWYWYCDNCQEIYYEEDLYMNRNHFPNFCPNCGAKMKGGKE